MDSQNKRIAKNTLYMYIRLFSVMFIGLYSSRIVLQVLGVSDYGLFNVVGGILSLFTFIVSSLSNATTRFFNIEMGKPDGDLNKSFNINFLLHASFALVVFVLGEILGLWYIFNMLNVESGKINDALFVYEVTLITTCIGIVNSPYASIFNAYERFKFLAELDIINTLLRFCCVLLLQFYQGDYTLRFYSFIMCFTTTNTCIVYHYLANRDWPEIIKIRFVRQWDKYKEVITFSNWNLLTIATMMIRTTGSDLLLNSFFCTSVNGAFAISKNISGYVNQLSASFDNASGPQIIQAYSSNNKERYTYLAYKLGRINLLIFELLFFPLFSELYFILQLWLGVVPEGTLLFSQLQLIMAAVALSSGGITQLVNATGKIKWFSIQSSFFFLTSLLFVYVLFKLGFPPFVLLLFFIGADILQRIVQLLLMHYILDFDSLGYVKEAYTKPLIIALLMLSFIYLYSFFRIDFWLIKIISILLVFIMTALLIYTIGITNSEREQIKSMIKKNFPFISRLTNE